MTVQICASCASSAYRTGSPPASVTVVAEGELDGDGLRAGDGLLEADGLPGGDGLAFGCAPPGDGLLSCAPVVRLDPGARELAGRVPRPARVAAAEADRVPGRPALARWICWCAVDRNGSSVISTTASTTIAAAESAPRMTFRLGLRPLGAVLRGAAARGGRSPVPGVARTACSGSGHICGPGWLTAAAWLTWAAWLTGVAWPAANACSAAATSVAGGRAAGSFARQPPMIPHSASGKPGTRDGTAVTCACRIAAVLPVNGGCPASSSYRVVPSAYTSPAGPGSCPPITSGGRYVAVPSTCPAVVNWGSPASRAMPKSARSTWPLLNSALAGLRSR